MINTTHAFNTLKQPTSSTEKYTSSSIHESYVIDFLNEGLELLYQAEDFYFPSKFSIDISPLESIFNAIADIMVSIDMSEFRVRYDEVALQTSIETIRVTIEKMLSELLLKSLEMGSDYNKHVIEPLTDLNSDLNHFINNIKLIMSRKIDD